MLRYVQAGLSMFTKVGLETVDSVQWSVKRRVKTAAYSITIQTRVYLNTWRWGA